MTNLSKEAVDWLATGERGTSSNTLFKALTGVDALGGGVGSHPRDPDDFRRCELLLRAAPELRCELERVANISPVWEKLVVEWDGLVALIDEEAPEAWSSRPGGRARRTFERMEALGC